MGVLCCERSPWRSKKGISRFNPHISATFARSAAVVLSASALSAACFASAPAFSASNLSFAALRASISVCKSAVSVTANELQLLRLPLLLHPPVQRNVLTRERVDARALCSRVLKNLPRASMRTPSIVSSVSIVKPLTEAEFWRSSCSSSGDIDAWDRFLFLEINMIVSLPYYYYYVTSNLPLLLSLLSLLRVLIPWVPVLRVAAARRRSALMMDFVHFFAPPPPPPAVAPPPLPLLSVPPPPSSLPLPPPMMHANAISTPLASAMTKAFSSSSSEWTCNNIHNNNNNKIFNKIT